MGAGPPVQSPGYTLPGAEYFALAPNRSIALGPRLSITALTPGLTVVPPDTPSILQLNSIVDPNWTRSSGLYLVRASVLFIPDLSAATGFLQITQARMGLGQTQSATSGIELDIGLPTSTLTSPQGPQIVIYERDALVTGLDFAHPQNSPLFYDTSATVTNTDPTNPHSWAIQSVIVFHRVNGFVQ